VNKFLVLFSFVGCSILCVRNEMNYGSNPRSEILNTLIALANDVKRSISCSEVRIFAER